MKKVSTRLNIRIATKPKIIGTVIWRSTVGMGAESRPCLSCIKKLMWRNEYLGYPIFIPGTSHDKQVLKRPAEAGLEKR